MDEKWTNTSSPFSLVMKPKPLASLNHLTLPEVLIGESPFCAASGDSKQCSSSQAGKSLMFGATGRGGDEFLESERRGGRQAGAGSAGSAPEEPNGPGKFEWRIANQCCPNCGGRSERGTPHPPSAPSPPPRCHCSGEKASRSAVSHDRKEDSPTWYHRKEDSLA